MRVRAFREKQRDGRTEQDREREREWGHAVERLLQRVYICNPVRNAAEEELCATVPQDERGEDGSGGFSKML